MVLEKLFYSLGVNLDDYERDLDTAAKQADSWAKNFGSLLTTGVLVAVTAVAAAIAGIGVAAFDVANQVQGATASLQAELGVTGEEAERLGNIAADVWGNNFAGSIEEAATAVGFARQQLGDLADNELQRVTERAFALQDVFGVETTQSIDAAKTLMEQFGLTSDQAFDFIAKGYQEGLDRSGDFLDTVGEYSNLFGDAGFEAEQFFSLLETGAEGGVLGTDKIADAVKEFGIIFQEGGDNVSSVFEDLGLSYEDWQEAIASGNTNIAELFSEDLLPAIQQIEDPLERNRVQTELFGTAAEDLGNSFAEGLSTATTSMEDMGGAADSLDAKYNTLGDVMEGFKRKALLALEPLGAILLDIAERVMPLVEAGFAFFEESIVPIFEQASRVVGSFFSNIDEGMTVMDSLIEAIWDIAPQEVLDALVYLRDNIIGVIGQFVEWEDILIIVGGVVAAVVIPALVSVATTVATVIAIVGGVIFIVNRLRTAWQEDWGGIKTAVMSAWENTIKPALQQLGDWITGTLIPTVQDLYNRWVTEWWPAISASIQNAWENVIKPALTTLGTFINETLIPTVQDLYQRWTTEWWPQIETAIQNTWTVIETILTELNRWINDNIVPIVEYLYTQWVTVWWPEISAALTTAWEAIKPALETLGEWLGEKIPAAIDSAKKSVDPFIDAIKGFWDWISSKTFDFKIKLPDLPDWAIPGSPIPLHTRWKDFGDYLAGQTFTFDFATSGLDGRGSTAGIGDLLTQVETFVDNIAAIANKFNGEVLDKVGSLAESSLKIAELVPLIFATIDAINERAQGDFYVAIEKIAALKLTWETIFEHFAVIGYNMRLALDRMGTFLDASMQITELIPAIVENLAQLRELGVVGDYEPEIAALRHNLEKMIGHLMLAVNKFDMDGLAALEIFAKAGTQATGLIKTAIDGILSLRDFDATVDIGGKVEILAFRIAQIVDALGRAAKNFEQEGLAHLEIFSRSASSAVGLVEASAKAFENIKAAVIDSIPVSAVIRWSYDMAQFVGQLINATDHIDRNLLDRLADFSQRVQAAIGLVEPAAGAMRTINETTQIGLTAAALDRFADNFALMLINLAQAFSPRVLLTIGPALARLEIVNSEIQAAVSLVKPAVEAVRGIEEGSDVENVAEKADVFASNFAMMLVRLSQAFTPRLLLTIGPAINSLSIISERVQAAVGLVKPAAEAIIGINEASSVVDAKEKAAAFATNFTGMLQSVANAFTPRLVFAIGPAITQLSFFGEQVQVAVGLIKPATEAIVGIDEASNVVSAQAKAERFARNFAGMIESVANAFPQSVIDSIEPAISRLHDVGEKINTAVSLIKPATEAILGIDEASQVVSARAKADKFAVNFVGVVKSLAGAFTDRVIAEIDDSLTRLSEISDKIQAGVSLVKPAADAIIGIDEASGVVSARSKADKFAKIFASMVQSLADAFPSSLIDTMQPAIDRLAEVAEKIGSVVGLVKPAAEAIVGMVEASKIKDAKEKADKFAENFADLIDSLVTRLAAAALNLSNEDIDAAAGLAERSAALVGHVADVQGDLESIVNGDAIEISQLEDALGNIGAAVDIAIDEANNFVTGSDTNSLMAVFDNMVDVIGGYAAPLYETGRGLGQAIVDGMKAAIDGGLADITAVLSGINPPPAVSGGLGMAGMAASGGGAGSGSLQIEMHVHGTSNPQETADIVVQKIRELVGGAAR